MGYQIALSPSARRDLRDIVRYISVDSPERAVGFARFLVSSTKRLSDFPEMGRVVPEFADRPFERLLSVPTALSTMLTMLTAGLMSPGFGTVRVAHPRSRTSDERGGGWSSSDFFRASDFGF